jgi:hypothetical protein
MDNAAVQRVADRSSSWIRKRCAVTRVHLKEPKFGAGLIAIGLCTSSASSSSYPDGHIDDLAAQVGNVLANVFGTELVCRTVEILRQLHVDVVRALAASACRMISQSSFPDRELLD